MIPEMPSLACEPLDEVIPNEIVCPVKNISVKNIYFICLPSVLSDTSQ